MSARTFRKLANKVAAEYRRNGMSAKRARKIGNATAGKVSREKRRR